MGTPGTKMWNLKDRGFWAFKVTHEKHVAEHINANYSPDYPIASSTRLHFEGRYKGDESVISQPYGKFHAEGRVTAPFYCKDSLVTIAGEKGSLVEQDECEIKFLDSRPASLSTPVNP